MYRLLILGFITLTTSAWADVINVADSERGFVCTVDAIFCPAGNNGANAGNNYAAGAESTSTNTHVTILRDWFEFAIPSFSGGSLASATLSLDNFGHFGNDLILSIYGLNGQPSGLNDVVTTNPFFGSHVPTSSPTITIQLNSAALAAIEAAQGGVLFIGGIDSGETVTSPATADPGGDWVGDFETSQNGLLIPANTYNAVLNLTTASATVPEPSSVALMLTAAFGAGLVGWRRGRNKYGRLTD